jgi:hypothetical protein
MTGLACGRRPRTDRGNPAETAAAGLSQWEKLLESSTSMAAPPGFWDSLGGRVLLIGLGFLAGMGATASIAVVVE